MKIFYILNGFNDMNLSSNSSFSRKVQGYIIATYRFSPLLYCNSCYISYVYLSFVISKSAGFVHTICIVCVFSSACFNLCVFLISCIFSISPNKCICAFGASAVLCNKKQIKNSRERLIDDRITYSF